MKRFVFPLLVTGAAVLLTITSIPHSAYAGKTAKKRNDLTGVWLVNVEIVGEATGANPEALSKFMRLARMASNAAAQAASMQQFAPADTLPPFTTVETFHSDGTFAENSLVDYFQPATTPGRGAWERIGDGEFSLTFFGVLYGAADNPDFLGTYRERARLKTNETGDQFSGPATIEFFDPNGNPTFSLTANAQGTRPTLPPAP